jgi:hypothetical protein
MIDDVDEKVNPPRRVSLHTGRETASGANGLLARGRLRTGQAGHPFVRALASRVSWQSRIPSPCTRTVNVCMVVYVVPDAAHKCLI